MGSRRACMLRRPLTQPHIWNMHRVQPQTTLQRQLAAHASATTGPFLTHLPRICCTVAPSQPTPHDGPTFRH